MCFQVQLNISLRSIIKDFKLEIPDDGSGWKDYVLGPKKLDRIPVIYFNGQYIDVDEMYWSLCPSWSKEFPCKWATYNARMEKIDKGKNQKIFETPTFKNSFRKNQFCLVPIVGAVESCYWGEPAGQIVEFQRKGDKGLYVLGLWDEWLNKETGELIKTTTLLTDNPYSYFFERGHARSIMAYDPKKLDDLLLDTERTPEESFKELRENRITLDWKYTKLRDMKEGWEKRKPPESQIQLMGKKLF